MASSFMRQFAKKKVIGRRSSKKYLTEALYKNLLKDGGEDRNVRKNLNLFIKSRKSAYKWEVGRTLQILRRRKLYGPALKLSETMEKRGMNKTVRDQAIHLHLVAKTQGTAAAETYFINLPESSKDQRTYGALLHTYCKELMIEKSQALLQKMKDLNLELTAMSYNSIMSLYLKSNLPQTVPTLIQEMKSRDIMLDPCTYNLWFRSLAAMNDIGGVDRVLDEMKRDGRVAPDCSTYSNLASIYVEAGLFDKAENALKELESKNSYRSLSVYQYLITLYGRTGNLLQVYRVWRSLKLAFPNTANISYLNMIQVLVKLNDIPGAENCFKEWSSNCSTRDVRIANVLIGAYLREGLFEKAEKLRKGAKPNAKTWEHYLDYYLNKGDVGSAVDSMDKAATSAGGGKFVPSPSVVKRVMQIFEEKKDVDGAERFIKVVKKCKDELDCEVVEWILRIYSGAGRKSKLMEQRVKMEKAGGGLSEEGRKLLSQI
ncbi:hypothetical protein M569_14165, partial [Genlisea aurea]